MGQMKGEVAMDLFEKHLDSFYGGRPLEFRYFVCDMNRPPADVVDLFERAFPLMNVTGHFLAVLTFKLLEKQHNFEGYEEGPLLRRLQNITESGNLAIKVLHLFANTKHEQT